LIFSLDLSSIVSPSRSTRLFSHPVLRQQFRPHASTHDKDPKLRPRGRFTFVSRRLLLHFFCFAFPLLSFCRELSLVPPLFPSFPLVYPRVLQIVLSPPLFLPLARFSFFFSTRLPFPRSWNCLPPDFVAEGPFFFRRPFPITLTASLRLLFPTVPVISLPVQGLPLGCTLFW